MVKLEQQTLVAEDWEEDWGVGLVGVQGFLTRRSLMLERRAGEQPGRGTRPPDSPWFEVQDILGGSLGDSGCFGGYSEREVLGSLTRSPPLKEGYQACKLGRKRCVSACELGTQNYAHYIVHTKLCTLNNF